ncbi:MAG: hypothetical protein ABIP51_14100 [Bacteroidia bacterium]
MKIKIIISFFTLVITHACRKDSAAQSTSSTTPVCLKNNIEVFEKNNSCSTAHVNEMTFQNKTVYVFDPGNCGADMTAEVIDNNCKSLGYLGGFAGNTKIEGVEFSQAKFIKTIWSRN